MLVQVTTPTLSLTFSKGIFTPISTYFQENILSSYRATSNVAIPALADNNNHGRMSIDNIEISEGHAVTVVQNIGLISYARRCLPGCDGPMEEPTIPIDEAKFVRRNYNRGNRVEGFWLVGGIVGGQPDKSAMTKTPEEPA